ncbi:MAG: DUF5406 family protein [Acutalibacteraceae bacterium]
MLKYYAPGSGNNEHTIRITFMVDDYVGHVAFVMGGNCRGSALLKADFLEFDTQEDIDLYTENDCACTYHPDDDMYSAILKNSDGDTLCIDGDEREFQDAVVAIEYTNVKVCESKSGSTSAF